MENEPVIHIIFDTASKLDDMIQYDTANQNKMFVSPEDMESFIIGVKTLIDYIDDM